jgi:hypothetical protein
MPKLTGCANVGTLGEILMDKSTTISVDAEVDGLHGRAFAIAFTVRKGGKEVHSWSGRCPDRFVTDGWVREKILPTIADMPVDHADPDELEDEFFTAWLNAVGSFTKDGVKPLTIAHCGYPVESGLFSRCIAMQPEERAWSGPFPLHDVATLLLAKGRNPLSVDAYLKEQGIAPEFNGATHHPMYDAVVAAQVWEDLLKS